MLMRCWATSSHLCLIVWFQSDRPCYASSPLCPINACSPAILIDRPMLLPPARRKQSRMRTWCTAKWFSFVCVCLYMCVYIWKWKSRWFVSDSLRPHGLYGILQATILEWAAFPFSRGSSPPRDWTQVSALRADSLRAEPTGKPVYICAAAAAKSLQSCPTLCDPIDGSPPGSPVPGILQARTLEWVAISFSNVGKWKVKV